MLFIPGNNEEWILDAPKKYDADGYIYCLEDGTPPSQKEEARNIVSDCLDKLEDTDDVISVRVNDPKSEHFHKDLEKIVKPGLDVIAVPKIDTPETVKHVESVLTHVEKMRGLDGEIDMVLLPETPMATHKPFDVLSASDRVSGVLGAATDGGDYNRAVGYDWSKDGWESVPIRSRFVSAARAAGVSEIMSGMWTDIEDIEGLRHTLTQAKNLGFTGYWVVHPSHIEHVNEIFSPSEDDIQEELEIVEKLEEAYEEGRGAVPYKGNMIDEADRRTAKKRLSRARDLGLID